MYNVAVLVSHTIYPNFGPYGRFTVCHYQTVYFMFYLVLLNLITWINRFRMVCLEGRSCSYSAQVWNNLPCAILLFFQGLLKTLTKLRLIVINIAFVYCSNIRVFFLPCLWNNGIIPWPSKNLVCHYWSLFVVRFCNSESTRFYGSEKSLGGPRVLQFRQQWGKPS